MKLARDVHLTVEPLLGQQRKPARQGQSMVPRMLSRLIDNPSTSGGGGVVIIIGMRASGKTMIGKAAASNLVMVDLFRSSFRAVLAQI